MRDEPRTTIPISGGVVSGVVSRPCHAETIGPFELGSRVGSNYEVRHILGAGGMGVVYDAFDSGLARRVALKAALSPIFADALRSEGQTLAAVRSASFVDVFALDSHQGVDFLVLERLYGERLDRRIEAAIEQETKIPLDDVVDALIGIAKALVIAHGAGIAQRDVKPSNTIVVGDRVVLFDFGLAIPEVLVRPETMVSGSVDYISPELILGLVSPGGGPGVDLYALGITAYELLTTATPFGGDLIERTLTRHVTEAVPDVRERRADAPAELAYLVRELLEKDPQTRPASAEAVLWQLEAIKRQGIAKSKRPLSLF